jgi:hypothetical protein
MAAQIWAGDEMRLLQEGLMRQMSPSEIQDSLPGRNTEQVDNMREGLIFSPGEELVTGRTRYGSVVDACDSVLLRWEPSFPASTIVNDSE